MGKIIDKINKKIASKIYNKVRQIYLKKSICNIGRIVEEEDKIICYVEQKMIDRYKGDNPIYELRLNGMNQVTAGIKETVKNFRLNKPVYYIFDCIEFNTGIKITSFWANIMFKNCTFDKNIGIIWGDEITFENNKYTDSCSVYFYGKCFLTANRVNKITFINDDFVNSYKYKQYSDANFGMQIDAKLVEFINTKVDAEYPATVKIKADKTIMKNSVFRANEVCVDSKSIAFADSLITAQNGVMIENANCDLEGNVQAPIVFFNGIDLATKSQNTHKVNEEEAKLKEARQKLIEKLRNLSNYCQRLNDARTKIIQDELNNQTVTKTLTQK